MVIAMVQKAPLGSVDLVIRIGCSLGELGIVVGDIGEIKEAPSGLFDKSYSVHAINGKRFKPESLSPCQWRPSPPPRGFSIAIDWVAPVGNGATQYHLQWREQAEPKGRAAPACTEWASSAASERISVPCCTKGSLRTATAYQFRVRAFSELSGRWGPWSLPSEPTRPSTLLEGAPSRPELRALKGLAIEAEWSPPLVGAKAKVAGYEVQWCLCGSTLEWASGPAQQLRTAKESCTTGSLRQGKCYTFRVRTMIKNYTSSKWTAWSLPAAPCRTYRDAPPELAAAAPGGGARDATESMIEGQLARDAEECPTEIRSAVRAEVQTLREQHAQDRQTLGQPAPRDEQTMDTLSTWD